MLSVSVQMIHISSSVGDQPVRQHMDPQWEERALRPGGKTESFRGCELGSSENRKLRVVEKKKKTKKLSRCRWSAMEKSVRWTEAAWPRWLTGVQCWRLVCVCVCVSWNDHRAFWLWMFGQDVATASKYDIFFSRLLACEIIYPALCDSKGSLLHFRGALRSNKTNIIVESACVFFYLGSLWI